MSGTLQDPGGRGFVCGWCLTLWPEEAQAEKCYGGHGRDDEYKISRVDGPPAWLVALFAIAALCCLTAGLIMAGVGP